MESGWGSVIVQLRRTNTEGVARKVFLIIRDLAATFLGATRIKSSAETCWGVFCYQEKKGNTCSIFCVQLLATDISALATMKNAAKCDT